LPARQGYTAVFLSVALLMAAAVFALILTIREKKLAVEQAGQEPTTPRQSTMGNGPENSPISGDVRKSLYYLLASIFLWFTAYNVVTTAFSRYAGKVWGMQGSSFTGIGWSAINVNSYPMVVEMSRSSDVGKYTGYYYTFSMAAQIFTPILSGFLLENVSYRTLFPYSVVFSLLSLCTMLMVRHGDSKPPKKDSNLKHFNVEDC
jgi:predicted MFS family arabinose efflux permease